MHMMQPFLSICADFFPEDEIIPRRAASMYNKKLLKEQANQFYFTHNRKHRESFNFTMSAAFILYESFCNALKYLEANILYDFLRYKLTN